MARCRGKYPTLHVITPSPTTYATRLPSSSPVVGEMYVSLRIRTTSCSPHTSWAWHDLPFSCLRPNDINHCSHQTLGEEGTIHDWTGKNGNTSLGGSSDDVVLLGAHHVRRPGGGCRSAPRENLITARILGAAVRAGELLPRPGGVGMAF